MRLRDDRELWRMTEQKKERMSADLGDFAKFLAYTHDDGPDDVELEGERHGIRKLKGTPVWALLYPARKTYRAARFVYENGVSGVVQKAEHKIENNRFARRKEARKFLTRIMPTEEEKKKQRERTFQEDVKFSVLVPLYNTPERYLRDMIESVIGQTYQNWELCLADASDGQRGDVGRIAEEYAAGDARVVYRKLEKNEGIAENTNHCIRMASGEYLALFDHDDLLHPSALYECAAAIAREGADFLYTDEVTFEGEDLSNIVTYHFKPDFSVDNLRGVNYICHLSVFQKELTERVGLFRPEYDGSQDHDMILRLTDAAGRVCHIPKVLYFWRCHQMSTSMNLNAKSYAIAAGRGAVADAERRRGYPAKVHSAQICKTHYRMVYDIGEPKVSVVIDGTLSDREQIAHTAASVGRMAAYRKHELLFAEDVKGLTETVQEADGDFLLFLSAGISVITPSFLEELLMFAQREDVGLVGMQVLDEKGLIYSSDLIVGAFAGGPVAEANRGQRYDAPGYMGRNYYAHNVSAVSGFACMGKAKRLKGLLGACGARSAYARALELCFLLRQAGEQIVVNPYALCRKEPSASLGGLPDADRQYLLEAYKAQLAAGDPFYNKNLSTEQFWQKI